jgi:hypothetical protein
LEKKKRKQKREEEKGFVGQTQQLFSFSFLFFPPSFETNGQMESSENGKGDDGEVKSVELSIESSPKKTGNLDGKIESRVVELTKKKESIQPDSQEKTSKGQSKKRATPAPKSPKKKQAKKSRDEDEDNGEEVESEEETTQKKKRSKKSATRPKPKTENGAIIWAKMKTFPWWPGKVQRDFFIFLISFSLLF